MQIPTVFAVVTSITHVQVRQAANCESAVSSVEAKLPPMPTVIASLSSAAKTDACTLTAMIRYESELDEYRTKLEEWLQISSNAEVVNSVEKSCSAYFESSYSAESERMTSCALGDDKSSSSSRPRTSSAATNTGSTNTGSTAATTTAAQTGSSASAAGAASSSAPAAGAGTRSAASMFLAAGAVLVGGFLVL